MGAFEEAGEPAPGPMHKTTLVFKLDLVVAEIDDEGILEGGGALVDTVWQEIPESGHQHDPDKRTQQKGFGTDLLHIE